MQIPVIAWIVYGAIRLIGPTLRLEVVGVHNAVQIRTGGEPGIGAFWHRCIFSAAWIWRNRGIVVLNTVNFDGQWTRRVIERLGFGTAQGSSTRGAIEGLSVHGAAPRRRSARGIHDRRPARPALRREARPDDSRAPHRQPDLRLSHRLAARLHLQEFLGSVSDSVSLFRAP